MAAFTRLVRFASGNQTYYGDLIDTAEGKYTVKKLSGDLFELKPTEEIVTTDKVRPRDLYNPPVLS